MQKRIGKREERLVQSLAMGTQHEMDVDGDGRLVVADVMSAEEDKMELLGLTKDMTRRKMPNAMAFILHKNEEEIREKMD